MAVFKVQGLSVGGLVVFGLDLVSSSLRFQGTFSDSTSNLDVPRNQSAGMWMCASIVGVRDVDFLTIGTLSGRVVCHQVPSRRGSHAVEGVEASKTLQPCSAMHLGDVFCSCPGNNL